MIKYKEKKNLLLFINFLIFLKKFKFVYKFYSSTNKHNIFDYITLQKKSNLYFKSGLFSNKILKKKVLNNNLKKVKIKGKKKNYTLNRNNKPNNLNNKLKFFKLKDNFLKKIKLNTKFFKNLFLKAKEKKKRILYFFKNISKKSVGDNYFNNTLLVVLYNSHFFFSLPEIKFFIKKGLVYLNNKIVDNYLTIIFKGDLIQLVYSKNYYRYINKFYNFFKDKIKFLKFKKWKFNKSLLKQKYKNWNPKFLSLFFLFKKDIPNNLEVDFTTLSIIYLKVGTYNIFKFNINLLRTINPYFIKSYSWKRIT